jgi:hypothetical protein
VSQTDEPQDVAEALDADEVTADGAPYVGDEPTPEEFPPTHLSGVNAYGLTAAEERTGEPYDERISRDEPDDLLDALEHEDDPPSRDPAWDDPELGDAVGRLVEPNAEDDGVDAPDEDAEAVASAVPADDLTAEEAAVHVAPDLGRE